jgi:hypothetical protein
MLFTREKAAFSGAYLRKRLQLLGGLNFAVLLLHAVNSHVIAARRLVLVDFYADLVLSSALALFGARLVARHARLVGEDIPRMSFRFAATFAAASIIARPILVPDFWLSVIWGRMVASGENPYYTATGSGMHMTWGPVWALFSGAVMKISNGHGVVGAILFKLTLGCVWISTIWLVWMLQRKRSPAVQSISVIMVGWLPLGVTQCVAEGHIDGVMMLGVLSWIYCTEQRKARLRPLALAASILVKFVTAPLIALDALQMYRSDPGNRRLATTVSETFAILAILAVGIALFLRSFAVSPGLMEVQGGHFYSVQDAVAVVLTTLNVPDVLAMWFVRLTRLLFPTAVLIYVIRYLGRPSPELFRELILLMMCAGLFSVVQHVWPWYLVWTVIPAAVAPSLLLSRWLIGLGIVGPFVMLPRLLIPNASARWIFELPAVALYVGGTLAMLLVPKADRADLEGSQP